jgi:hypothetical protein
LYSDSRVSMCSGPHRHRNPSLDRQSSPDRLGAAIMQVPSSPFFAVYFTFARLRSNLALERGMQRLWLDGAIEEIIHRERKEK